MKSDTESTNIPKATSSTVSGHWNLNVGLTPNMIIKSCFLRNDHTIVTRGSYAEHQGEENVSLCQGVESFQGYCRLYSVVTGEIDENEESLGYYVVDLKVDNLNIWGFIGLDEYGDLTGNDDIDFAKEDFDRACILLGMRMVRG